MSDAQDYYDMHQDRDTKRLFLTTPKNIKEARKEVRERIHEYSKSKPNTETFVIEINGKFAGYVAIKHLNEECFEHSGSVGYCIKREYRNKGIVTEAVKMVTKYAFKKYKLKRIEGTCRTFNKASARVLEKSGYKLEGIHRKRKFKNGRYLDDMTWAKVK